MNAKQIRDKQAKPALEAFSARYGWTVGVWEAGPDSIFVEYYYPSNPSRRYRVMISYEDGSVITRL